MANLEITTNKTAGIVLWEPVSVKAMVTFAVEGTLAAGTILALDTTTLKLVPFVKGGTTAGNGIPHSVLREDLTATAAGDVPAAPIISGRIRAGDLIIAADGDASNVDAAVINQLRDFTIIAQDTVQLAELDNQ